jgi:hypothetical protein
VVNEISYRQKRIRNVVRAMPAIVVVLTLLVLPGVFAMFSLQVIPKSAAVTVTYTPNVNLSKGTGTVHLEPTLAVTGTHVYISYEANLKGTTVYRAQIFFTESNDSGSTFSTPMSVSNNKGGNTQQRLAISGKYVYDVWMDNQSVSYASILFRANSNYGGHTAWGKVINLTKAAIFIDPNVGTCGTLCGDPTIAANGTNVYVTWTDSNSVGGQTIMFDSSADYGKTWAGPVSMRPTDTGNPHEQEMAAWGNNVYVTWDDTQDAGNGPLENAFFTVSHNNGGSIYSGTNVVQNFTNLIKPNTNGFRSREPHVAAWGGNVYVTWEDNRPTGNYVALIAVSTNSGNSFTLKPSLSKGLSATSWLPVVVASGNYVYDTWYQNTSPKQVFMAASTNGGSTFTTPIKISADSGNAAESPLVAAQGPDVFMFWKDTTYGSGGGAVGALSTNAGASFPSTPNVFSGGTNSYVAQQNDSPQTAIVGNLIFISWTDTGPNKPTSVYYSTGTF